MRGGKIGLNRKKVNPNNRCTSRKRGSVTTRELLRSGAGNIELYNPFSLAGEMKSFSEHLSSTMRCNGLSMTFRSVPRSLARQHVQSETAQCAM